MKHIISDRSRVILQNKDHLEKSLNIKITNKGKVIIIDGIAEDEYLAERVIHAINFSFPIDAALILKDEENIFHIINIKDISKSSNLARVRGRIIGTERKTLDNIENLTKCILVLKDNKIGIIGYNEDVENAIRALTSLVKGSKTANVYSYLEKHHSQPILDLGLKPAKKKTTTFK
ncbi:MAG: hypothetical protein AABY22_19020 [Nanoarchaeota archaeon]